MKPVSPYARVAGATLGGAVCGGVAASAGVPLLLAAVIGGATYYGLTLVFAAPPAAPVNNVPAAIHALLAEAEGRVNGLIETARNLPASLAQEISAIARTAREIMAEIAAQPAKLDSGQRFLTHYLDSTQKVLEYYGRLRGRKNIQVPLELESKLADVLTSVRLSFQQHRESLIADDLVQLSTELDVLQQTVELEKGSSASSPPP